MQVWLGELNQLTSQRKNKHQARKFSVNKMIELGILRSAETKKNHNYKR